MDELNLASSDVLQTIAGYIEEAVRSGIMIIAAINPSSVGGDRKQLPNSISDLFTKVELTELSWEELLYVASTEERMFSKWIKHSSSLCKKFEDSMTDLRNAIQGIANEHNVSIPISLRVLEKMSALLPKGIYYYYNYNYNYS